MFLQVLFSETNNYQHIVKIPAGNTHYDLNMAFRLGEDCIFINSPLHNLHSECPVYKCFFIPFSSSADREEAEPVKYTLDISLISCSYWSNDLNYWTNNGCEVCH